MSSPTIPVPLLAMRMTLPSCDANLTESNTMGQCGENLATMEKKLSSTLSQC
jgi:hypothetical protein